MPIAKPNISKKVFKRKLDRIKQKRNKTINVDGKDDNGNKQQQQSQIDRDLASEQIESNENNKNGNNEEPEPTLEGTSTLNEDGTDTAELNAREQKSTTNSMNSSAASVKSSILTNTMFNTLRDRVSEATLNAIAQMGFDRMTEIQANSIPPLLEGKDVLGAAKTGSGKTLAFLIPAIEKLLRGSWKQHFGTGVIIISPTRELSIQTYSVLCEMMEHHPNLSHCLIMGGKNRQTEAERLIKGAAILVATPGRLLDHLQNTTGFVVQNLRMLIMDEADRIFDIGFEQELHQIIRLLPKQKRQTALFSATCSPKVDELVRAALRTNPMKIGTMDVSKADNPLDDIEQLATREGLEQGYVVCPSEKRFLLLFTFLKKNRNKKIMVFFSSCASVKYHHDLLNFIDLSVLSIHGKQKQQKRTCTFFQFCQAKTGTLLCTDVAARGLDIPEVDWIIQYDPPDEPREYIHRVGRTARGESGTGNALLILRPEELGFLRFLKAAKVTLNEYEFSWNKLSNIQPQLEKLVSQNYHLNKSAREAYKGYIRAYDSHSLKQIYDINTLDLIKVCKSFGFETPPFVDLPVSHRSTKQEKTAKLKQMLGGRQKYGANNGGKRSNHPGPKIEFVPFKKKRNQMNSSKNNMADKTEDLE